MRLSFFIFFSILLTSCASPQSAEDYCRLADKQATKEKSVASARANYLRALQIDSTSILAYDGLGCLLMVSPDISELNKAREYFDHVLTINPNYAPAWFHKGMSYAHEMKFSDAISSYDKALHLEPGNAEYFYSRGIVYINSGNTQKGYEDFRRSCEFGNMDACRIVRTVGK
jgi:tetratricopeptide (TPR) repeat protein